MKINKIKLFCPEGRKGKVFPSRKCHVLGAPTSFAASAYAKLGKVLPTLGALQGQDRAGLYLICTVQGCFRLVKKKLFLYFIPFLICVALLLVHHCAPKNSLIVLKTRYKGSKYMNHCYKSGTAPWQKQVNRISLETRFNKGKNSFR